MALSFLYAFLRTLQIHYLERSDDSGLAIEVVMLRQRLPSCDGKWPDPLCDLRIERSLPASAG